MHVLGQSTSDDVVSTLRNVMNISLGYSEPRGHTRTEVAFNSYLPHGRLGPYLRYREGEKEEKEE